MRELLVRGSDSRRKPFLWLIMAFFRLLADLSPAEVFTALMPRQLSGQSINFGFMPAAAEVDGVRRCAWRSTRRRSTRSWARSHLGCRASFCALLPAV